MQQARLPGQGNAEPHSGAQGEAAPHAHTHAETGAEEGLRGSAEGDSEIPRLQRSAASLRLLSSCPRRLLSQPLTLSPLQTPHHCFRRAQGDPRFPLFISQDGSDRRVRALVRSWEKEGVCGLQHVERAPPVPEKPRENLAYYRIAAHYKFALGRLFDQEGFRRGGGGAETRSGGRGCYLGVVLDTKVGLRCQAQLRCHKHSNAARPHSPRCPHPPPKFTPSQPCPASSPALPHPIIAQPRDHPRRRHGGAL